MKVLLTYANRRYRKSQKINTESAKTHCSFDQILELGPRDLSARFRRENSLLLQYKKGAGYWVWKPYVIAQALRQLSEGDELFYCDSGARFVGDATQLFEVLRNHDQDIFVSCSTHQERTYTKRDAFVLMGCDRMEWANSEQRIASFLGFRNSKRSRDFCREWLRYCTDERIVTDSPNVMGKDNYSGFKEHKHDQSVLSLLSKRASLQVFRDPSQWGNSRHSDYPNSPYGQLIEQTWLVPDRRFWFRVVNRVLTEAEDRLGIPRG